MIRSIPIDHDVLLSMKESGELIGKYIRNPNTYRRRSRIQGRVTRVKEVLRDTGSGCSFMEVKSTHSNSLMVEAFMGENRFGKYIGSTWGSRIYLEKEWRRSCKSCAYSCRRGKICGLHSDNTVVIRR